MPQSESDWDLSSHPGFLPQGFSGAIWKLGRCDQRSVSLRATGLCYWWEHLGLRRWCHLKRLIECGQVKKEASLSFLILLFLISYSTLLRAVRFAANEARKFCFKAEMFFPHSVILDKSCCHTDPQFPHIQDGNFITDVKPLTWGLVPRGFL